MRISRKRIIHTSVFQNGPNGGNPCPVVLDGEDLETAHGKYLAATFGAETIIILNSKKTDSDFGLRYFVPTEISDSNPTRAEVCSALRIPLSAISENMGPIVSVSTSRPKLIVPIIKRNILDRIEPDFEMLRNLCDRYDTTGFYPFAMDEAGGPNSCFARQFPIRAGYNEDPATGVAACALGVYLTKYNCQTIGWHHFNVHQGHAMGKPSHLEVGAYLEKEYITKTCVSGNARILGEESIALPDISRDRNFTKDYRNGKER